MKAGTSLPGFHIILPSSIWHSRRLSRAGECDDCLRWTMDLRRKALEREFAAAWTRLRSLTALDLQARILRMLQVSGLLVQVVHVRVDRTSLGAPS